MGKQYFERTDRREEDEKEEKEEGRGIKVLI
jgi:hypothetical protein